MNRKRARILISMKPVVLSFSLILAVLSPFARAALPAHPLRPYVEGRVIVKYKPGIATGQVAAKRSLGMIALRAHLGGRLETLALPAMTTVPQALALLRADPAIEYAEPDALRVRRAGPPQPDDPLFPDQWGLFNSGQADFLDGSPGTPGADMNLLDAWDPAHDGTFTGVGDGSATVAIIDDSVLIDHDDLAANIVAGRDFVNGDNDPSPDGRFEFHGTLVAGCVGAVGNNGKGVAGVAWNVKLMPLKFGFDTDSFLSAMDYARTHGANIVNASFGGPTATQSEIDGIQALADADILFVAAAGNDDSNTDLAQLNYPANYPLDNIVSAAATNRQDNITSFSQYGPISADVAAPGFQIVTASNNGYSTAGVSGTSFSSPYTAGVAALLKMKFPSATFGELKARLIEGAEPGGNANRRTAGGRVNAANSLALTARPSLVITGETIADANGVLDAGETTTARITLTNLWADATNVSATLSATRGIGSTSGAVSFGSIAAQQSVTRDFTVTVPGTFTDHQYADFTLALSADGYAAERHFSGELSQLLNGTRVTQAFARTADDPYDDFHAWHFNLDSLPAGHDQLVIETTAPADIDLLVKKDAPPRYDITVGINPEFEAGFFCTSGDAADNCQDPQTFISGGVCGDERVVIDNPEVGATYHAVVVNFAQLNAGLDYTLRAYTRSRATGSDATLCGGGGGGGGSFGTGALLLLGLAALRRREIRA